MGTNFNELRYTSFVNRKEAQKYSENNMRDHNSVKIAIMALVKRPFTQG